MPLISAPPSLPSQAIKPVEERPSASATVVANQTKVFHAALLLVISLRESTPVHSISTITSRAASAGSIQSAAKIHIISAKQTNTSSRISLRDSLPSFSSSRAAHSGTSLLTFTSGG
nr:Uncharacterised protein [Klebsiella pneumoniae]